MEIQRVVRDLVTTKRHHLLGYKSFRVVEDSNGDLSVASDPVGCKPGDFVITIGISAARLAVGDPKATTDLAIGGIIDEWSEAEWRG